MLTLSTDVSISFLMSCAASAQRCDSSRTSAATTENPRPCSPARAASTAAFSARILVCSAMASISRLISAILRELARNLTILGVVADRAGQLFHGRRDLLNRRSLLLGTMRKILRAGGDLTR